MKAIDIFHINFTRAEEVYLNHAKAGSDALNGDLLRSSVVMAVASLDAYIGMRICEIVKQIAFKEKRYPEAALMYILSKYGEKKAKDLTRELVKISLVEKPDRALMGILKEGLAFKTFQNPSEIEHALEIMEVANPWSGLDKAILPRSLQKKKGKKPSSKIFLKDFVDRRNAIVHEGDLYLGNRHHGKVKPIEKSWVKESLRKLKKMVLEIEKISQKT